MPITDFLSISDIQIDVPTTSKAGLLRELSSQAAIKLRLEGDLVLSEILKREMLEPTSLGGGIAVPHARIPDVERPFGIMVRLRKPIDFDAIDGMPVDLVCLLLLPTASNGDQLNALASIAARMRNPRVVQALRKAGSERELYRILMENEPLATFADAKVRSPLGRRSNRQDRELRVNGTRVTRSGNGAGPARAKATVR